MGAGMFERKTCYTADILIEFLVYSQVVKVLLMCAIVGSNGQCMSLTNIGIQAERDLEKVLNRECVQPTVIALSPRHEEIGISPVYGDPLRQEAIAQYLSDCRLQVP
jgi:hypothetical protein